MTLLHKKLTLTLAYLNEMCLVRAIVTSMHAAQRKSIVLQDMIMLPVVDQVQLVLKTILKLFYARLGVERVQRVNRCVLQFALFILFPGCL